MANIRQKRSALWKYFDEIETNKKAQCTYCGRILSITSGSVGNLSRHLRNLHPQLVESKTRRVHIPKHVDPLKLDLDGFELIASVENHQCLWKTDSEDYGNKQLKDDAWATVAEENSISVPDAQLVWRKLRAGFQQAVYTNTGEVWKYEKRMNFLLPYTKPPKQHSIVPKDEVLEATEYIIEQLDDEDTEIVNNSKTLTPSKSLGDTTLKRFFSLIHETAEELPEDLQLRVQRQLFNIVMEAKEEHMNRKETEKSKIQQSND